MASSGGQRQRLQAASLLCIALLLLTLGLGHGGWWLLAALAAALAAGEAAFRFLTRSSFPPYLFLLASPLLLLHYSSLVDFRIRLAGFVMLAYVLSLARSRPACRLAAGWAAGRIPPWRAWLASLLVLAAAAAWLHVRGIQLSGDEPHYIMMAQSLVEDGDLDLANNVRDKTYFSYLPVEIRFHGAVIDGRYRSFHLPGLSLLLLPFYWLFRLLSAAVPASLYFRLAAALINSLFALALYLALGRLLPAGGGRRLFPFFLATFPLVFHGVHLFPELPAAALLLFSYGLARERGRLFASGLLLGAVPWLHLKYGIAVLVLALFLALRSGRQPGGAWPRLKRLLRLGAGLAAGPLLLGLYSHTLYGSWNPAVISPEKNFLAIPLHFRIETLLSFFLDQRDGLLVYAPALLLALLAFRRDVRSRIRDFPLLAALFLGYVLVHAYTTVRGAYSPAARPLVFVYWILAVFLAAWRGRAGPGVERGAFRLLAGLTLFASAWLFYYPQFLYQPVTREVSQRASSLLLFWGSEALPLSSFFPSFLKIDNSGHAANWVWLGLLALATALSWRRAGRLPALRPAARLLFPFAAAALLLAFALYPHVQLQTRYSARGVAFYCNSGNFSQRGALGAYKALAGQTYDLFIDLKGSAARRVTLSLANEKRAPLRVRNGRRTLLARGRAREATLALDLEQAARFRLGKRTLVHLGLESGPAAEGGFLLLRFL